jgi:flagellar basal body-associated protein FliL
LKSIRKNTKADGELVWVFIIMFVVAIVAVAMVGLPMYHVWTMEMSGKADLANAEWSKQIAIEEAKAELESASLKAAAEVERAKGVAEANAIIGDSLKDNDAYLRYLWIQGLHDGSSETIYIPTEANLPILEAGRKVSTQPAAT